MSNQTTLTDQALWVHFASTPDLVPVKIYDVWSAATKDRIVHGTRIAAADILLAAFQKRRAHGFDITPVETEAAARLAFGGNWLSPGQLIRAFTERAENDFAITPDAARALRDIGYRFSDSTTSQP